MARHALEQRVVLREYGRAIDCTLTLRQAEEVRSEAERWRRALKMGTLPLLLVERQEGQYEIQAKAVTGFLKAGPLDIEIVPKFLDDMAVEEGGWRRALLHTLALVGDWPVRERLTDADETRLASFTDLMADTFLVSLTRGWIRGLPRGYVEKPRLSRVLTGRLNVSRITDVILRPWEVPCRVDVLDEDIDVNQLLRWGAEQLARSVSSPQRAAALTEVAAGFGVSVRSTPPPRDRSRQLTLGPQHRALGPALRVAQVLLEGHSLEHDRGSPSLHGFLWRGESIFEDFAFHIARAAARRMNLRTRKAQIPIAIGISGERSLNSVPDIRFMRGDRTELLMDAKYKNYPGQPLASDTYQVVTGGKALNCKEVALIYPGSSGQASYCWQVQGGGEPTTLSTTFLDLTRMEHLEAEKELVEELTRFLKERLEATP